ncbi:MAG: 50S ribosomal protein L22 [Candidatus Nealsonbacteria bacterium RIFCSPLOWO2_12_FULL_39_31]|uniref:Large ribosomal subunit protein uL22 n=2 Tax=Candidatus Nealsoniibacteriota TaxID=1817911 RepID=A0A1G2EMN5_9BACT|nr:MAG: 50S ribosomal protein L22 [Parcubacteria group bacterium GW2011_GWA2_38_27]KKQ96719.1 MAG: 50S ribosomal protein L22 [Parcubacteria group bacterium GW2011_GWC2_39_11]OGZ19496.1 MAG: 50S ribosomal protein L22 [Candidatus Nealsonbacteria bacterium RIFCSPHIGHO2_01_FULL_38_55]OGZ21112.1 MAG: 50S ribosomal protein L22 [Candidatus Nealsonbacteria bacterium RIFCSPHIGHO2_02_38_10]OGZ21535.1 MAG: 50S ribosomal protein L22 [Candidatus Nealsonbacteria bacterium RIFCSPHIGHO2_02_FULL_38_75]OGZ22809
MEIKAKLNYLRIAPRKVRLVANMIRGKKAQAALSLLDFVVKRPGLPIMKLLSSAIANAHNNFHIEPENLFISKITVDEGPMHKRWMPRARGVAGPIHKKTSHITLILEEVGGKIPSSPILRKAKQELKAESVGTNKEEKTEKIIVKENPKFKSIDRNEKLRTKPTTGIKKMFRRKVIG